MERVTQNRSAPSPCAAALPQGICHLLPFRHPVLGSGCPCSESRHGVAGRWPRAVLPPQEGNPTHPQCQCHKRSLQIGEVFVKWCKSHRCVDAFLGGLGEVSTSWAVWLNHSSFVPQYTCRAYIDSCLLYFICMYEFYRKLHKSHSAFLKGFFEPAPDLRTLGKKGEGRRWGIDTCSSSWKWKSRSPCPVGCSSLRDKPGPESLREGASRGSIALRLNACMQCPIFDNTCCLDLFSFQHLFRHLNNFPPLGCRSIVVPLVDSCG